MTPLPNRECGRCQGEGGMETALGTTLPAAQNSTSLALNVSHTPGSRAGELSEHQQYVIGLFLSCVYTIFLFPIGFLGNILILVVNIRFREKMTIPDLYFINLAAADLILVADSLIEVFNLDQQYYDVAVLCTFMSLFLQVNMYSSVFFLTWMSFDRYVALARAMRGGLLRTMRHARLSCGLIWMASVSATLVPFAAVHLQRRGEACLCFADAKEVQWLEVTLGFLVPFAIIGLCYSLVVRVLVRAHRHRSLRPRRQKALRMILAVVLVFFTCWLPENVFISVHLLQRAPPGATPCKQSFRHAHPLTGHIVNLAAFSNSCLNPLIYSFLGETFRDKLRLYLEQKPGVSALNRLCHTALKAVVPDSTERPSRRLGNTAACSGQSAQPSAGDGAWFTVQQSPEGGPATDTPEWHSRIGSPGTASHRAHTHDSPHAVAHMPQPLCHSHSLPCAPYSLAEDV